MTTKSALWLGLAAGLLAGQTACDSNAQAWGEANAIIVVAMDSLWQEVGDSVTRALEPPFVTVREERTFNVTHVSPMDTNWVSLRRFRQVLAIGVAGDGWVSPAVTEAGRQAPYLSEQEDVWANEQRVTAAVVSSGNAANDVRALLPALRERLDSIYRAYAASRMYQSEPNAALMDSLGRSAGFTLTLPNIYRSEQQDSLWVFRAWSNVQGELRRTVAVTWQAGLDTTTSTEAAVAWRHATIARYMQPQTEQPEPIQRRLIRLGELRAFEVQGAWNATYSGVPMGGAFITRMIPCPAQNRTYLVDAWLYAPSREKYEYMIQLEVLLNSFRCGSDAAPQPNR